MFESTRRSFHGGTVALLGQDAARELQKALELTRRYCVAAEHYAELAKGDPDFAGSAEWYRDLCAEAHAALSKIRSRVMRQMPGTERGMAPPTAPTRPAQRPPSYDWSARAVPISPQVARLPVSYRAPRAPFAFGPTLSGGPARGCQIARED